MLVHPQVLLAEHSSTTEPGAALLRAVDVLASRSVKVLGKRKTHQTQQRSLRKGVRSAEWP